MGEKKGCACNPELQPDSRDIHCNGRTSAMEKRCGVVDYLQTRYDECNVKIGIGLFIITCPTCKKEIRLSPDMMEGTTIAGLVSRKQNLVFFCGHCESGIQVIATTFAWYFTSVIEPPSLLHHDYTYKLPERNGPLVCSNCGDETDELYHIEQSPERYLGPMDIKCIDCYFNHLRLEDEEHEIRVTPLRKFISYPVNYTNDNEIKAKCPHCLRMYPVPKELLDSLDHREEEGPNKVYTECAACGENNHITIAHGGLVIWSQTYGDD